MRFSQVIEDQANKHLCAGGDPKSVKVADFKWVNTVIANIFTP